MVVKNIDLIPRSVEREKPARINRNQANHTSYIVDIVCRFP